MKHLLGFLSMLLCAAVWLFTPSQAEAQADVIYACVNNGSGTIKIVDPLELCGNNEIELIWNASGTEGPQGPPGPPGEQGPPGPPGSIGGSFVVQITANGEPRTTEPVAASFCAVSAIIASWSDTTGLRGCIAEPTSDDPSLWILSAAADSPDSTTCRMRCIP